ncbi:hypothetical protein ACHHYP_20809, partial [Achlya hypogyna]
MAGVLTSRELLVLITAFQDGIDADLRPLRHKKLLYCRRAFDPTQLEAFHSDFAPWWHAQGTSGLDRLLAAMPYTRRLVAVCAAKYNYPAVVRYLCERFPDSMSNIMLHTAAREGNLDLVRFFVDASFTGSISDLWCIAVNTNNVALVALLVEIRPLQVPTWLGTSMSLSPAMAQILLAHGIDLTPSAMYSAAKDGCLE